MINLENNNLSSDEKDFASENNFNTMGVEYASPIGNLPEEHFTNDNHYDTISEINDLLEGEEMQYAKFYNTRSIILYTYVARGFVFGNSTVEILREHIADGNIKLYESPYIAKRFAGSTNNKTLIAVAVYVGGKVLDRFDPAVYDNMDKSGKKEEDLKADIDVVRELETYKAGDKKQKQRVYISYTVYKINCIQNIYPV